MNQIVLIRNIANLNWTVELNDVPIDAGPFDTKDEANAFALGLAWARRSYMTFPGFLGNGNNEFQTFIECTTCRGEGGDRLEDGFCSECEGEIIIPLDVS